ncbi:Tyrosine--tRNA ligase [compost metagenome]
MLANEATRLAHGAPAAEVAANAARGVFDGAQAGDGLPTLLLAPARLAAGVSLAELAVEAGLAASRSAARRLAAGGGLRLDGMAVNDADQPLSGEAGEWRLSAGRKQHVRIAVGE